MTSRRVNSSSGFLERLVWSGRSPESEGQDMQAVVERRVALATRAGTQSRRRGEIEGRIEGSAGQAHRRSRHQTARAAAGISAGESMTDVAGVGGD